MEEIHEAGDHEPIRVIDTDYDMEIEDMEQRIHVLEEALWEEKQTHFSTPYLNKDGGYCNKCTRAGGIYTDFPCDAYKDIEDVLSGSK